MSLTPSRIRRRLIAVVTPALDALGSGRGTAVLVVLLGALALGVTVPVRSLVSDGPGGTTLSVPSAPPPDAAVRWTASARGPGAIQTEALGSLFQLLQVLAWIAFAVAAVSLLAIFNIRAAVRGPDLRVHRSVGASQRALLLSLFFESGLLVAAVAGAGLVLAGPLLRAALVTWPGPASSRLAADWPLLAATAIVMVGGLLPLGAARMRNLAREIDGQVRLRFSTLQLGLSFAILMAGALLADRSGSAIPAGDAPVQGLVFQIDSGSGDPAGRADRFDRLLARLGGGRFDSVSLAAPGELNGLGTIDAMSTDCGECFSGGIRLRWHHLDAVHHFVSPDTFAAEGFRIERGRSFTRADGWTGERVAVVNRYLALRHFQGGEAVGRALYLSDGFLTRPYRVVGVVDDARSTALGGARQPLEAVYLSVLQHPPARVELTVRGVGAGPVQAAVGTAVGQALGPAARVTGPAEAAGVHRLGLAPLRWFGRSYTVAGGVALAVAVIGVFSSLRLWVGSIGWELGLRRSVGATRRRVAAYVLARGLGVGLAGVALGLFLFLSVLWGAVSDSVVGVAGWRTGLVIRLAALLVLAGLAGALLPLVRLLRDPPVTCSR